MGLETSTEKNDMKVYYTDEEMNLNRLANKTNTAEYKDALRKIIHDDKGCVETRYIPELDATSHLVWRGACPVLERVKEPRSKEIVRHRCHAELTLEELNWLLTNLRYMKEGKI